MILRLYTAAFLSIFLILFTGCSDDPSSIGSDLIKGDQLNILEKDSFTDSLNQTSSYAKYVSSLSASAALLLGRNANVESSILLKFFFQMADLLKGDLLEDSISIISSEIVLRHFYYLGDSSAAFDFSAYKVTSMWGNSFSADSLNSLAFDPSDVSFNKNYINGDTLIFNIDNQLVLSWLKAAADTNVPDDFGLYLKSSENSQKIVGFDSYNSSAATMPDLRVTIEKPGVYQDTILSFLPAYDISVAAGEIPSVSIENIVVQNSLETKAKIFFDLASIPAAAVINHAELALTLDTLETIRGSTYTNSLRAFFLTDSLNNSLDSFRVATLAASGIQYKGDITSYAQSWINGTSNQGLLITSALLGEGVELLAIKGSNSADASIRPRLKIVYTLK